MRPDEQEQPRRLEVGELSCAEFFVSGGNEKKLERERKRKVPRPHDFRDRSRVIVVCST